MSSKLSFRLFLVLVCMATGRSFPLIDSDTFDTFENSTEGATWNSAEELTWNSTGEAMQNSIEDTLSNSPEWKDIPNAIERSQAANDTAQRWAQSFVRAIFDNIEENIEGPYYEAYSSFDFSGANANLYSFDADTRALLNKTSLTDLVFKMTQGKVHDAMDQEIDVIGKGLADIVSDIRNWLSTEGLVMIDLRELSLNPNAVLDAISSNTTALEQKSKKIEELMTSIESLSARAESMGTDAAIYYAKLYNYIQEVLPAATAQVLPNAFGHASVDTERNSSGKTSWNSTEEALRNYKEGTLWNTHDWEEQPNATELVSVENDTAHRWIQAFVVVIFTSIAKTIEGPYNEAYLSFDFSGNKTNLYKFDADTKASLNAAYLPKLLLKMAEGEVHDVLDQEIDVITQNVEDIVSDMPNWLDTEALEKVDLSQIKLNVNVLLDTIISNAKVPGPQYKKIRELMTSIKSLSARAESMGTDAAIYYAKLFNYLEEAAPAATARLLTDIPARTRRVSFHLE